MESGLWSCVVAPNKPFIVQCPASIRITNVALGVQLADQSARTTLKLSYQPPAESEDEEEESEDVKQETTYICALTPGKIEQFTSSIVLEEEETYLLEVVGPNTLYLTGNYIDYRTDLPPFGDEDSDEEGHFLEDVSSDVEMDADELDGMDEMEDVSASSKNLKRPREDVAVPEKAAKKQKGDKTPEASEKKETKKEKKEKKKAEAPKAEGETKKAAVEREITGGIKVKDTKIGTGPTAKKGNTVSMRYIGKLTHGKVFDQNTKGKPFVFHLGKGEVIKGWDEGIVGMQAGGERVLTIPAPMAYGKRGSGKDIPPNSTLVFEVKLVDIK